MYGIDGWNYEKKNNNRKQKIEACTGRGEVSVGGCEAVENSHGQAERRRKGGLGGLGAYWGWTANGRKKNERERHRERVCWCNG
jgi:hypothetical protein